jgi:hypothetical protein
MSDPTQTPRSERRLRLTIGEHALLARLEMDAAPISCAALLDTLPFRKSLLHARWSGECGWSPLGDVGYRLAPENALRYPSPGQILLYAGDLSEPEILMPYGSAAFACKAGPLAGNHVLTVVQGGEHLAAIGKSLLWNGALPIAFEA